MEDTEQQVDSGIAASMKCVRVNIMWKIQHSRWSVVLQLQWSMLQWTLCGWYSTAGGRWYCSLNGVCYSEHYVEDTAQQEDGGICSLNEVCYSEQYVEDTAQEVDSVIAAWMECITVNIMWKILHSMWTVVLQLEWRVLEWTLCGRYFTACGQWYCSLSGVCYSEQYVENFTACGQSYCSLNALCYSEHYLEGTSMQVDTGIATWMACVSVNIMFKILQLRYTLAF